MNCAVRTKIKKEALESDVREDARILYYCIS